MLEFYRYNKTINKKCNGDYLYDLYVFKSIDNHRYLIEVEHRDHNTKIVKFYLKNHKDSKNKFSLTIKRVDGGTGVKNFIRILNTLLEISKAYYKADNTVSFAFMGAPHLEDIKEGKNNYPSTKRYKIYKTFSLNYFSTDNFDHITFEDYSCYLIKNKLNKNLTLKVAEKLLLKYVENS